MTVREAWEYILSHCLNEIVMDDDEKAKEAVDKVEDILIPFMAILKDGNK